MSEKTPAQVLNIFKALSVSAPAVAATEEQIDPDYGTAVVAHLVTDPEIGERAQSILRELSAGRPAATAVDIAATPAKPGLYLDRLGNVWRRHHDGEFAMSSRISASAAFYAPFQRLEVVGSSLSASADPADEHHDAEALRRVLALCDRQDAHIDNMGGGFPRQLDVAVIRAAISAGAESEDHAATVTGDREKLVSEARILGEGPWRSWWPGRAQRALIACADALAAPVEVDEAWVVENEVYIDAWDDYAVPVNLLIAKIRKEKENE